ncbi:MAG: hypothetical protein AAGC55_20155, partial [Myxococcota bacterium]
MPYYPTVCFLNRRLPFEELVERFSGRLGDRLPEVEWFEFGDEGDRMRDVTFTGGHDQVTLLPLRGDEILVQLWEFDPDLWDDSR